MQRAVEVSDEAQLRAKTFSVFAIWKKTWLQFHRTPAVVAAGAGNSDPNLELKRLDLLLNGALALFAALMVYGSYHHQLIFDEAQAWIIARDSHGVINLFRNLHHEGHPALWYLLLYLPAHVSSKVGWMQGIHCILSVAMGWLIISDRRIPRAVRIMTIFSAYPLFFLGVFVRSYVLAAVLLITGIRCLLARAEFHWWGMLALALAINTHFLAIPLAFGIFWWGYVVDGDASIARARHLAKDRRFWGSVSILLVALGFCYLAVRPAPDVVPKPGISPFAFLILGMGREIWRFFVPFSWLLPPMADRLWVCAALIAFGLVGVFALPTRRARSFMVIVTLAWTLVEWLTAHSPSFLHASFVFISYVIALLLVDAREWSEFRKAKPLREQVLHILLGFQVLVGFTWFTVDMRNLTSAGKLTAAWIADSGLAQRPLVIEPDLIGPSILAHSGIASAYYPACRCEGSFVVFREDRDALRQINREEIETLRVRHNAYPILIVSQLLPKPECESLGLKLLYRSPHGWMSPAEDTLIYGTGREF